MAQVFLKCLEWRGKKDSNDAHENIDELIFFLEEDHKRRKQIDLFFQFE